MIKIQFLHCFYSFSKIRVDFVLFTNVLLLNVDFVLFTNVLLLNVDFVLPLRMCCY